jgi:hypothetical protein
VFSQSFKKKEINKGGFLKLLSRYIKVKGVETGVIQLLNLFIPLLPLVAELGFDMVTDVMVPLLKTYNIDEDDNDE